MRRHARTPHALEQGFTLIELLVVILIIGVLAAIAIPTFLDQKTKAVGASGREVARSGAEATETFSTDHSGNYIGLEPKVLHEYEPSIQIAPGNNGAYVSVAEATEGGRGFTVTAIATDGDTFTWTRTAKGEVTRVCETKTAGNNGGCQTGSW